MPRRSPLDVAAVLEGTSIRLRAIRTISRLVDRAKRQPLTYAHQLRQSPAPLYLRFSRRTCATLYCTVLNGFTTLTESALEPAGGRTIEPALRSEPVIFNPHLPAFDS
jgi:hypothetical protein